MPTKVETICDVITVLETATRLGAEKDEPEGTRYVQISETLVEEMLETLRQFEYATTQDFPIGRFL